MQSEWVALARDVFEWVKSGIVPFTLFLIVFIIWICRDTIKQIPQSIINFLTLKNKSAYPEFTNKDVKRHPVFDTLKFWLANGIQALSYDNYYIASLVIGDHKDTPDYIKAKEEMARMVLTIKFEELQKTLMKMVEENDFSTLTAERLQTICTEAFNSTIRNVRKRMVEDGMPPKFIAKYISIQEITDNVFRDTIRQLTDHNICIGLNTPTRAYLVLDALAAYVEQTRAGMVGLVVNINGDLNGEVWKGKMIGRCIAVETPVGLLTSSAGTKTNATC